ncbi:hypothetical protein LOD99_3859 [Oopsacas minuta]|uniref:tyrosine--tRNA ligase n=1 Tax=Oopsacas minuta TaxID=111878 RepID=A0AAV7JVH7_9METZ|nr:hypothetical protein LOD99_3859 [Oopsacas minuta]
MHNDSEYHEGTCHHIRDKGSLRPIKALDEEHLQVDAQFGGVDQRKIFTFAEKYLPKIGYRQRLHLMNPMIPGLTGGKMSSSVANSKIDILDSPQDVKSKLLHAYAEEGVRENNGVLAFTKFVLFRLIKGNFIIDRPAKFGGQLSYPSYSLLELDYMNKVLHPQDLKVAVAKYLNIILAPIREEFVSNTSIQKLVERAYPSQGHGSKMDEKPFNQPL